MKQIHPIDVGTIVAGKKILSVETSKRKYVKNKPSGKYVGWTLKVIYEVQCLHCGSIRKIGISAMDKRIKQGTERCGKCRVNTKKTTSTEEVIVVNVDSFFPAPPAVLSGIYFNWGQLYV
jgi:transcription elongation factor Elf1